MMGRRLVLDASLASTVAALRAGDLPVSTYLAQVRARMQVDADIRAFVPEPERWRRIQCEADALTVRMDTVADRPALFGVAVGIKDCLRVDGLPTRAGSELPADLFQGHEASVVTTVRAAGALVLGKTAMDEFAYGEPAPTRNPQNLAHTPGGSSAGSAAAVAAGLCPLALGTQTSRSIIGPAAFCGVVGFKPSFGRISMDGVVPLSPSFDTVGLFTQDVAGMSLAATTLIPDWGPTVNLPLPVLGVPEGTFLTWTLAAGRRAYERHLGQLCDAGYKIRRVPFFSDAEIEDVDRRAMVLLHGEMARVHADWFGRYPEHYRPRTARAIRRGQAISDEELADCRGRQSVFRTRVERLMRDAGIDLWVTPASGGAAPLGLDITGWGGMTTVWSYAGLPCATVPASRDEAGLPFGLQGVATFGGDEHLLAWMAGIESVFSVAGGAGILP